MLRIHGMIGLWMVLALLLTACQPIMLEPELAAQPADEDVAAAVNALWREYEASILAGDAERWIQLWMEEGVQLPPDAQPVEGRDAIFDSIQANLAAFDYTDFVIVPEDLVVEGDMAVSRGNYTLVGAPTEGGEPFVVDGKYMTLLRRQPDGSWKIYRDIFNSNVPPAPVAAEETDVHAVTEEILAVWDEYAASLAAGDVDRWVALWAAEGIQLPPGEPPVVGKEAIRSRNKAALTDLFDIDMSITNEEVQVGAGWAVARGVYSATLTPKAGGDDVFVDGKYMTLLQQQPDGSWKIYRDIFNSNVPPGGEEAAAVLHPEDALFGASTKIY